MKSFLNRISVYSLLIVITSCKAQEANTYSDLDSALQEKEKVSELNIYNNNEYSSFPLEIYSLSNLEVLSFTGKDCDANILDCKNIKSLPKGIVGLSNLKELYLVMNNIQTITDEINELKNLRIIDLSNNKSISLDNLRSQYVESLNLNECGLEKLPKGIFHMKNLKSIGVEGNNISSVEIEMLQKVLPNCEIYW